MLARLAFPQLHLVRHDFGDVLDAKENSVRRAVSGQPAAIEQHGAAADVFKLVSHLEVIEEAVPGQDVFQQLAQPGNLPLAVAELKNQAAFGFGWRNLES